jgi:2-iminobutanoate/2-iminopropanoate deaminase
MTKTTIQPAGSAPAIGPYSPAVRVGDLLFSSGQIGIDPVTSQIIAGGIRAETERVLQNLILILKHEGLTMSHVVKTTVFMTNLAEFAAMNEVYGGHFPKDPPARTTVQVAALPRGAAVEIEVIAHY